MAFELEAEAGSSIRELLPHSGAAVLLRRILEAGENGIECLAVSGSGLEPLNSDGSVSTTAGVEYMAQAAAAYAGIQARASGAKPKVGYVVAARRVVCECASFGQGQELRISAKKDTVLGSLCVFDCEVRDLRSDKRLMSGTLSVYLSDRANETGNS